MSTSDDNSVGSVQVKVSSAAVHKAVRNILANEMNLDPVAIKAEVQAKVSAEIHQRVKEHIDARGYGSADLHGWVTNALKRYEGDIVRLIREAISNEVHKVLNEEIETLIEGYVREGIELRIGWQKKAKVKLLPKTGGP